VAPRTGHGWGERRAARRSNLLAALARAKHAGTAKAAAKCAPDMLTSDKHCSGDDAAMSYSGFRLSAFSWRAPY